MQGSTQRCFTQRYMQTRAVLFSLCIAVLLSALPLYAADDSDFTFQQNANEVRLAFTASDRHGRLFKTVRSSDVAVVDNGNIIRRFRSFRAASETPVDLVILIDASDSLAAQIPKEIAEVKSFVAHTVWGRRDRLSILSFGGMQPQLICVQNCNAEGAASKLDSLRAHGLTPLYDALVQASEVLELNRDPESRPAMILFSDGVDTFSMHSSRDAVEAAQNLQAPIYSVNSRSAGAAADQGDFQLQSLAAVTGGLSFEPGKPVAEALQTILDDLHSGYVLTYELPQPFVGQHTVRVLPTGDPELQFRSRMAYDAGTGN